MGTSEVRRGAVAERVSSNIKEIRQSRGLTGAQLAELLGSLGRPMLPTAVNKIETGHRRVDVDDLVAFALALNTTPNRLLLNKPTELQADVQLADNVTVASFQAWAWADGHQVLLGSGEALGWGDATFGEVQRAFQEHAEPPAPNPAVQAVNDLKARIAGFLGWVQEYAKENSRPAPAGTERPDPSLERLVVSAEELRQSLNRIEQQIGQLVEGSPLADGPEYGAAFFDSMRVHQRLVERLNEARADEVAQEREYLARETAVHEVRHRLFEMERKLDEAQEFKDRELAMRLTETTMMLRSQADESMAAQVNAQHLIGLNKEMTSRAEQELYNVRRLMLIRNMVPPRLPAELAYVDERHPTERHAEQLKELWQRVTRSRVLEFAASHL